MGGMDTQLMGTSRVGGEEDPCRVPAALDDFPVGDTEFAVGGVEDLPRPAGGVDAEGEFDVSRVRFDPTLNQRHVGLAHPSSLKLQRQVPVRFGRESEDHQPGSLHVQTMGG